jgi:hypothetical protein
MRVEVKGTQALINALAKAGKRAPQALGQALSIEAESIMATAKRGMGEGPSGSMSAVDTGTLRASGNVQHPKHGVGNVSVTMGFGGPAAPYALYIHEGTGPAVGRPPFHPPVEPFKDWARRVLGDESLAYAVAASVGKKGLRPRKFLERPFRASARGMSARLARRIRAFMRWEGGR